MTFFQVAVVLGADLVDTAEGDMRLKWEAKNVTTMEVVDATGAVGKIS